MTELITSVPHVEFYPPRIVTPERGLFAAITQGNAWVDIGAGANRFSIGGVRIRTINYGGEASSGVWDAPWCGDPNSEIVKGGERPAFPDKFEPIITWAYDACDEFEQTRAEVRENAQRWLQIQAPLSVERAVGTRLLEQWGLPAGGTDFLDVLSQIETAIAQTGLPGFIHASPTYAPYAADAGQIISTGPNTLPVTPLGSTWVFGGGYVETLGQVFVATSQPYGWKDSPAITEAMYEANDEVVASRNQFVTIAEQTFAVGYEQIIAAVGITG